MEWIVITILGVVIICTDASSSVIENTRLSGLNKLLAVRDISEGPRQ